MIHWTPHTQLPSGPEVALIAVRDPHDDHSPFLLAELYRWDPQYRCWFGEANALLLKHEKYWWAREAEFLADVPSADLVG